MPTDRSARPLAPPSLPLLLAGLMLSGAAAAAELGALTVSSDFGRPLRATVEVLDLVPGSAPAAAAAIASPETYRELSLPFPDSLAGATATLVPTSGGRWLIRVEGRAPVAEPDFNMVVSLTTDRGRQLRNYRLVQPAAAADILGPAVAAPTAEVVPSPSATAHPPPRPLEAGAHPAAGSNTAATAQASAPVPAQAPVQAAGAAPAPAPAMVTVAPGDTATTIARRLAPPEVTDAQAAMALYRVNTARFQGSVHRLPAGVVLNVPDASAWRELSPAKAVAALRGAAPAAGVPQAGGDRLVLGGGSGRARGADGDGGTGRATGAVAHEAAMAEAQSRIRELESIVEKLRRLLEATDAKLAAMQGELDAARRPAGVAPAVVAAPAASVSSGVPATPPPAPRAADPVRAAVPPPAPPTAAEEFDLLWPAVGGALLVAGGVAVALVLWRRRRDALEAAADHDDEPLHEGRYDTETQGPYGIRTRSRYNTEPATMARRAA
jgi:Tfp pilus assembly protein FimV